MSGSHYNGPMHAQNLTLDFSLLKFHCDTCVAFLTLPYFFFFSLAGCPSLTRLKKTLDTESEIARLYFAIEIADLL